MSHQIKVSDFINWRTHKNLASSTENGGKKLNVDILTKENPESIYTVYVCDKLVFEGNLTGAVEIYNKF